MIDISEERLRKIIREELQATQSDIQLLTPEQTSAMIGIKVSTLANWRSRGIGPKYTKFGELVRYPAKDLEKHIEDHTR